MPRSWFRAALLLCVAVLPTACGDRSGTFGGDPWLAQDIRVEPIAGNPFGVTVHGTFPVAVEVYVEYGEAGAYDHRTPTRRFEAGSPSFVTVLGLRADREYTLRMVADDGTPAQVGGSLDVATDPLPDLWPEAVVESASELTIGDDEEVFCSNGWYDYGRPVLFCIDRLGEPVWQMEHPGHEELHEVQALSEGGFAATARTRSVVALFDSSGAYSGEFAMPSLQGDARFQHDFVSAHDVIEIVEGDWEGALAFLTVAEDQVQGEPLMAAGVVVYDPRAGTVHWDWSAHGELGDGQPIDPSLPYDRMGVYTDVDESNWQHANALLHGLDESGQDYFWVSLRAQDWIIKIDPRTDEVVWRLGHQGDFDLVEGLDDPTALEPRQWMYQQHAPEWQAREGARTRFLVYDNGVIRAGADGEPDAADQHSRIVEMEIDEDSMRAAISFVYGSEWPTDADHFFVMSRGDADMLPGGESLVFSRGDDGPSITEISYPGGEQIWRVVFPDLPWFYRVEYYPSLYEMGWWYDVQR